MLTAAARPLSGLNQLEANKPAHPTAGNVSFQIRTSIPAVNGLYLLPTFNLPPMSKLIWSITCVVVSILLGLGTMQWASTSIERIAASGPSWDFSSIQQTARLLMAFAALIYFGGLAIMISHIFSLPRPRRSLPCFLLVLPSAFLTFMAVLFGGPGDGPAGGYITYKLIGSIFAAGVVGLFFLICSLVSLGSNNAGKHT